MILENFIIGIKFLELINSYGLFQFILQVGNLLEMEFIGKQIDKVNLRKIRMKTKQGLTNFLPKKHLLSVTSLIMLQIIIVKS